MYHELPLREFNHTAGARFEHKQIFTIFSELPSASTLGSEFVFIDSVSPFWSELQEPPGINRKQAR